MSECWKAASKIYFFTEKFLLFRIFKFWKFVLKLCSLNERLYSEYVNSKNLYIVEDISSDSRKIFLILGKLDVFH